MCVYIYFSLKYFFLIVQQHWRIDTNSWHLAHNWVFYFSGNINHHLEKFTDKSLFIYMYTISQELPRRHIHSFTKKKGSLEVILQGFWDVITFRLESIFISNEVDGVGLTVRSNEGIWATDSDSFVFGSNILQLGFFFTSLTVTCFVTNFLHFFL